MTTHPVHGWPRIGVDIGGTKTAVGLVERNGTVRARSVRPTPAAEGAQAILTAVADAVREAAAGSPVAAVGVGSPGTVDARTGTVRSSTDLLTGWAGAQVGPALAGELALPVFVDNDVNVMALGELRLGAAAGYRSVLYVSVGTGVGGALALDGRIVRGARGAAGEIGHLAAPGAARPCSCGLTGHIEGVASGPSIEAAYGGGPRTVDLREITRRAEAGEERAAGVIADAARTLGRVLAGLVCAVDPEAVVLGGGVTGIGERFTGPLTAALRAEVLPPLRDVPVLTAALGLDAPLVGAALLADDLADADLGHRNDRNDRNGQDVAFPA